jgi:hypothetical protein
LLKRWWRGWRRLRASDWTTLGLLGNHGRRILADAEYLRHERLVFLVTEWRSDTEGDLQLSDTEGDDRKDKTNSGLENGVAYLNVATDWLSI